jgi:hypothetical protein
MKITIHIYHEQYRWEKTGRIEAYSFKHDNSPERMYLESREIDLPDVELLSESALAALRVVELRAKAQSLIAAFEHNLCEINTKIAATQEGGVA